MAIDEAEILAAGAGEQLDVLGERILVKGRAADGAWILFEVEKNPVSKAPAHSHPWAETYYLLSGGMRMRVADRIVDAGPGTSVHVPPNVVHQFLAPVLPNTRFLALISPASGEGFFRDLADAAGTIDPAKIAAIAGEHGVALVAPPA
jgi:mannose-6-phosphate isomerase-like protein (cupin superfamily)